VLKGMEETGRIRRGYFVAGLGATQFAMPGALDLLRSLRDAPDEPEVVVLGATDPANPYGATLKWPKKQPQGSQGSQRTANLTDAARAAVASDVVRGPTRSVGATVILVNGALAAYLARGDRQLITFLPDGEPDRSKAARAIAQALIVRARGGDAADSPRGMLIEEIDSAPPSTHPLAPFLAEAGFVAGALGMQPAPRSLDSRQSSVASRQSGVVGRPSKSTVSSPFARRYFADEEGGEGGQR